MSLDPELAKEIYWSRILDIRSSLSSWEYRRNGTHGTYLEQAVKAREDRVRLDGHHAYFELAVEALDDVRPL